MEAGEPGQLRKNAQFWAANIEDVTVDASTGRGLLVPGYIREHTLFETGQHVVLAGALTHIAIWNAEGVYDQRIHHAVRLRSSRRTRSRDDPAEHLSALRLEPMGFSTPPVIVGGIGGTQPRTFPPAGGLQISRAPLPFEHEPVMVKEVVELFARVPNGPVVDATVGGAGHTTAILDAHPNLSVIGLDQ